MLGAKYPDGSEFVYTTSSFIFFLFLLLLLAYHGMASPDTLESLRAGEALNDLQVEAEAEARRTGSQLVWGGYIENREKSPKANSKGTRVNNARG